MINSPLVVTEGEIRMNQALLVAIAHEKRCLSGLASWPKDALLRSSEKNGQG